MSASREHDGAAPLLSAELRKLLQSRGADPPSEQSFLEWALRIPEPKTGNIDLNRYPFQRELYSLRPDDPEVVVKKGTQLGVSTWLIRWVMYWSEAYGKTSIYYFPQAKQLDEFVSARVQPLIADSSYLRERVSSRSVQSRRQIRIGRGFVNFRGSMTEAEAIAIDADVLAFDEYDNLMQATIPNAERRLGGLENRFGLIRRVGVPSVPGYGISHLFEQSDKRLWHVRCDGCSEWQPLEFTANVDFESGQVVCWRCRQRLDVSQGEWVATADGNRDIRGYHITKLLVPNANLRPIIAASKQWEPAQIQAFNNNDLGLEFAPEDARLTLADIQNAQRHYVTQSEPTGDCLVTMGVDVASVRALHVRISVHFRDGIKRALYIGTVDLFENLAVLMEHYGVHMAVIDHEPDGRAARALAKRFPGRIYLVSYGARHQLDPIKVDEDRWQVSARRIDVIDETLDAIRRGLNELPLDLPKTYTDHLQALVRYSEQDDRGRLKVGYLRTSDDDFAQAEVYDVVAVHVWSQLRIRNALRRPEYVRLDELIPIERNDFDQYGLPEYSPGPPEPSLAKLMGLEAFERDPDALEFQVDGWHY